MCIWKQRLRLWGLNWRGRSTLVAQVFLTCQRGRNYHSSSRWQLPFRLDFLSGFAVTGELSLGLDGIIGSLEIPSSPLHIVIDTTSITPAFGLDLNVESLRPTILDVTGKIKELVAPLLDSDFLHRDPFVDQNLADLVPELSVVFDWYSATFAYFELADAFSLDLSLSAVRAQIATWMGMPTFDPANLAHLALMQQSLGLISLIEQADPNWNIQRYLIDIYAALHPEFDLAVQVPKIATLLELPAITPLAELRRTIRFAVAIGAAVIWWPHEMAQDAVVRTCVGKFLGRSAPGHQARVQPWYGSDFPGA